MDITRLEFLALLGVAGMLVLTSGIIFFVVTYQRRLVAIRRKQEKELTEAAIRAEEDERSRIASELHDDVGAMLASVKLNVYQAEEDGPGSAAFRQSYLLIEDTIDKVRKMSRSLQPAMLQHLGLNRALRAFFDLFPANGPVSLRYHPAEIPALGESVSLGVYRIVQELVNNTLKHAYATEIGLTPSVSGGRLLLRLEHNGHGLTEENFQEFIYRKDSTGLKNIVNRLKVLNASIAFGRVGDAYLIELQIPL